MYKIKLIQSITIIFCLLMGTAFADTKSPRPISSPSQLETSGKITKIFKKTRVIELDGTAYKLHPVHDIYTKRKGTQTTLYNLRPGMKVRLGFTTYQGKRAVHKVWILPKNFPTANHAH